MTINERGLRVINEGWNPPSAVPDEVAEKYLTPCDPTLDDPEKEKMRLKIASLEQENYIMRSILCVHHEQVRNLLRQIGEDVECWPKEWD